MDTSPHCPAQSRFPVTTERAASELGARLGPLVKLWKCNISESKATLQGDFSRLPLLEIKK